MQYCEKSKDLLRKELWAVRIRLPSNARLTQGSQISMLSVPILMYHRIGPKERNSIVADQYVPPSLFGKHLKLLKALGYGTVSLDAMADIFDRKLEPSKKPIVITFDDGYESFYTEALPALEREDMTATVFLVADCIGKTNRWDEAKGDISVRLMNRDQILAAGARGTEFGAHSVSHPDLRFCDEEMAEREIGGCRAKLREMLNIDIQWYCYPYGAHTERERDLVKSAGYRGACATRKGLNTAETDRYMLSRINVRSTTFPAYLKHKLAKAAKK